MDVFFMLLERTLYLLFMFSPVDDSVGSKGTSLNRSAMKRKLYMVKSIS